MTRRDLTGPASAYRDSKRRFARRGPNEKVLAMRAEYDAINAARDSHRPGLTRLHNAPSAPAGPCDCGATPAQEGQS